ncbi:MAG: hypothetical protein BGO69_03950 [Bacteroidetes bacterium 46-16]|nr:MAG: hypothetical protein BGO69_03950 [Bacteroidetes bacterium 46-16]
MVVIIWKGKGWLIIVVTFLCSLISEILTSAITNDDTYYGRSPYPLSIALLISALFAFYLNIRLTVKGTKLQQVKKEHALFFIPISYWGWILLSFSVLVLIVRLFQH